LATQRNKLWENNMARITAKMIDVDQATDTILEWFNLASEDEIARGSAWYDQAHQYALALAEKHDTNLAIAAGVISALSPGTTWERNLVDASAVFIQGQEATVSSYGRNKTKALALIAGDISPDNAFSEAGYKTLQFWRNIVSPDVAGPVTIDRHCTRAALGAELHPNVAIHWSRHPRKYERIQLAYQLAADQAELLPHQLQAIVWLVFRRLFGRRRAPVITE
jgi:hypothetical protein